MLKSIKNFDIAGKPCAEIDSADIVAFAQEKLKSGVTPQAVSNYMSHIRHILEGIDHVSFVACLVIGAPALRDLLWRITGFAAGHSVTLALGFFWVCSFGRVVRAHSRNGDRTFNHLRSNTGHDAFQQKQTRKHRRIFRYSVDRSAARAGLQLCRTGNPTS